ncbi:MAG: peroxiredoxin [bacterium]|nr:peroxiredoxin [bacterium]
MTLSNGDSIPDVPLRRKTPDGVETVSTAELFRGKSVALFGVPGAFTPACSDVHLPGFVVAADALREAGVDEIVCVAVNDAFVMDAWGRARGAAEHITFLADGNAELATRMGLELDLGAVGLGIRNRRYAALVRDGVIDYLGVEPGRDVGVSSAEAVLEHLASGSG